MTFHQMTIPPEEAQFLETRKFQINEIARIVKFEDKNYFATLNNKLWGSI